MDKIDTGITFFICGGIVGLVAGNIMSAKQISLANNMKFFRYTDDLQVVRTYEVLKKDQIFVVPDSTMKGINYEKYLESISNKYDRMIERTKIEKLIGL